MKDSYTREVLQRADALYRAECAANALTPWDRGWLRVAVSTLLAALMAMYPVVGAAAALL